MSPPLMPIIVIAAPSRQGSAHFWPSGTLEIRVMVIVFIILGRHSDWPTLVIPITGTIPFSAGATQISSGACVMSLFALSMCECARG
eukprot:85483-Rhodomonas_salina.1